MSINPNVVEDSTPAEVEAAKRELNAQKAQAEHKQSAVQNDVQYSAPTSNASGAGSSGSIMEMVEGVGKEVRSSPAPTSAPNNHAEVYGGLAMEALAPGLGTAVDMAKLVQDRTVDKKSFDQFVGIGKGAASKGKPLATKGSKNNNPSAIRTAHSFPAADRANIAGGALQGKKDEKTPVKESPHGSQALAQSACAVRDLTQKASNAHEIGHRQAPRIAKVQQLGMGSANHDPSLMRDAQAILTKKNAPSLNCDLSKGPSGPTNLDDKESWIG